MQENRREIQTSISSNAGSKIDAIEMLLAQYAIRRGGKLGDAEMDVYSHDLSAFEVHDIAAVLERLGRHVREEYESVLHPPNEIVNAVELRQHQRETRIRPEQLRPEVREAIERAEVYKSLPPGELEKFDVAGLLKPVDLGIDRKR